MIQCLKKRIATFVTILQVFLSDVYLKSYTKQFLIQSKDHRQPQAIPDLLMRGRFRTY